ncbi:MAG TPA: cytochrome c [Polyangiaceae bacterium]
MSIFVLPAVAACGPSPHTRAAGALSPLDVRHVTWNAAGALVPKARAVAEAGDVVAVFADDGATVFASGAKVATDRTVTGWRDAETLTGPDGSAGWIVGIGGDGRLYHLRARSAFEDVTERYGLGNQHVRGAAVLGGAPVFLLDREIALADGRKVVRYAEGPFAEIAGGAEAGALVGTSGVAVLDPGKKAMTPFALPGATHAAIGPGGRLYAATARGVYAANERGELALLYDAGADTLHGLVASGDRVWFADGTELGVVAADHVEESHGANIAADAHLAPSPSGDVWVLAASGVDRFTLGRAAAPAAGLDGGGAWNALGPVFARACAACHLPGGESGTDLSTLKGWQGEKKEIKGRVLDDRTMPPEGHALSDADRAAIRAWMDGPTP